VTFVVVVRFGIRRMRASVHFQILWIGIKFAFLYGWG
jgi:hypothetical protein